MTVNYNLLMSNSSIVNRIKLMLKWRGSLWKAIIYELAVWVVMYIGISLIYHLLLTDNYKIFIIDFSLYFNDKFKWIPLEFMLSFFVTAVVTRWTTIFQNIGLIDNMALTISAHIRGTDSEARMIRRNMVRYCVLAQVMVFRDVSVQVRKRFPTLSTIVASKFMSKEELETWESYDSSYKLAKYWMPIVWCQRALDRAMDKKMVASPQQYSQVSMNLTTWRTNLATVANFDWVPLPLMYPQLVFLAVHTYFYLCLITRQVTEMKNTEGGLGDIAIGENAAKVVLTVLQFVFYVGWLNVAEALLNPMGEDDDDFETNFLLDRNLKIGLAIVDRGYFHCPKMEEDELWSGSGELLYSEDSRPINPFHGSASGMDLLPSSQHEVKMVPLDGDTSEDGAQIQRKPSKFASRYSVVEVRDSDRHATTPSLPGHLRRRMSSNHPLDSVSVSAPPKSPSALSTISVFTDPFVYRNKAVELDDLSSSNGTSNMKKSSSGNNLEQHSDKFSSLHSVVDDTINEEDVQSTVGKDEGLKKYTKF